MPAPVNIRFNSGLLNLGDIIHALRYVFLNQNTEAAGEVQIEDQYTYWINGAYQLLENYDFSWSRKKSAIGLTTVYNQSSYGLPMDARDTKPVSQIILNGQGNSLPHLDEEPSFDAYIKSKCGIGGPRRFCYVPDSTAARTYSVGTAIWDASKYTVMGIGTSWLENVAPGDVLLSGAYAIIGTVAAVQSDLILTLTALPTVTGSSGAAYTINGLAPQKTIDIDPIPGGVLNYDLYYFRKFQPLLNDTDVPIVPASSRMVLVHGAWQLYQWFTVNNALGMSGIQPSTNLEDRRSFLNTPSNIQKFYNQFVAKMLADDKQLTGAARPRMKLKRGY